MWTERPRVLTDGLLMATACGLALGVIVSIERDVGHSTASSSQCQEVVVDVEKRGQFLAQCPPGTWLDIVDNNVVCRCGHRQEPKYFERELPPNFLPSPTQPLPPADPPTFGDKKGTEI